ncbi:MAG: hypothetical protein HYV77_04435, partial [Candidatus Wildermuthbacteria bacterium]|nr:hypothetical protein [Candidatus Wildermuthbacteria bacterium]
MTGGKMGHGGGSVTPPPAGLGWGEFPWGKIVLGLLGVGILILGGVWCVAGRSEAPSEAPQSAVTPPASGVAGVLATPTPTSTAGGGRTGAAVPGTPTP